MKRKTRDEKQSRGESGGGGESICLTLLKAWIGVVVLLAGGLIGLGYRVRVEERALVEALGQPYVDYMRHTQRFIPFLF
jgi:protein-S-isoprenylcysteine O-methyltransferase Ste14